MTRVFLSYASENFAAAAQLTREWRERGVEVFQFGEPQHRGEIIVDEIEREMGLATVYVALMSPAYLRSPWCATERRLAIHRSHASAQPQFIFVVEVEETPKDDAGVLGTYSWVNALGELTTPRLDEIATALPFGCRPTGKDAAFPGFRNRSDELSTLLRGLQGAGGRELWVVVAPPLMGKTWLLVKAEKDLVNSHRPWTVHRLDVRREPLELRYNPLELVTALLRVDGVASDLGQDGLQSIALAVNQRDEPLLFILDSAELLSPAYATEVRTALTAVHRILRKTMGRQERFAVVVATRRHDEWRGLGPDALTGQRFETLNLSHFDDDVVYQTLSDVQYDIGAKDRWSYAASLQQLSEGLPALLVRCVQWAVSTGFLRMDESEGPAVFDAVARDYIQKDLLAADSLLFTGSAQPEALVVLRRTLRVLSTYRLYTQSHITFHLAEDAGLRRDLETVGWTAERLWQELGYTALQSTKKATEIWHEIEPPLRRLLHRYHHPTDAERSFAHATARQFYGGWAKDRAAGREQQVVLVECLWHEASRLIIEEPGTVAERLPVVAAELARDCGHGPMYQVAEFRAAVSRRLNDDDELKLLLKDYTGLFARIVKLVTAAIGGDE